MIRRVLLALPALAYDVSAPIPKRIMSSTTSDVSNLLKMSDQNESTLEFTPNAIEFESK